MLSANVTTTPMSGPARGLVTARRGVSVNKHGAIARSTRAVKTKAQSEATTEAEEAAPSSLALPSKAAVAERQHGPLFYMRDGPFASTTAQKAYLEQRAGVVNKYFNGALGIDDYMARAETALFERGFTGENSIAMSNLCRDEVCNCMRSKIEHIFGSAFTSSSLGAVPTLGATGISAGISHSPNCAFSQKERYVFFSFAHIAIDKDGNVGNISRPGRTATSCACGAMVGALGQIQANGIEASCSTPGNHDVYDPEFSILKQRMARRMKAEGKSADMNLAEFTKLADRLITSDLEELIGMAVDTSKADYAVVTGIQVHSWSTDFYDNEPNLEFVWSSKAYSVVDGVRADMPLADMPVLTPRQVRLLTEMEATQNPEYTTQDSL